MKMYFYHLEVKEDALPVMVKDNSFYNVDAYERYNNPKKIYELSLAANLPNYAEEFFYILCLDTKTHCKGLLEVSHGTVDRCIVSPREVFQRALLMGASSIILLHNHPSNDVTPSKEDQDITRRMIDAGRILNIPVLDHIIIGKFEYFSFCEQGLLNV